MPIEGFALLSVHPRYASKILSGEKRLEFRKLWPGKPVRAFVIYATAPIQKIVGIAYVKEVHCGSPTALWRLARKVGGGVSRRDLYHYFRGRARGFGIEIESVDSCSPRLEPAQFLEKFSPPQSFAWLDPEIFGCLRETVKQQLPKGLVIFIAGVHGVGKTTLCRRIALSGQFTHKSASEIISEQKAAAIAANSKEVRDIAGNQQLLIDGVLRMASSQKSLLLDGHFVLLNTRKRPEPIPTAVFAKLCIDGVILVTGKPSQIAAQLAARDGKGLCPENVAALQALETSRAKSVSKELGLPLIRIEALDVRGFMGALVEIQKLGKK